MNRPQHLAGLIPAQETTPLLEYWRSINKRKWKIIVFAVAIAAVATAVVFSIAPSYRSTTTILVESSRQKIVSVEEVYSGVTANREYFQTQAEILQSRDLAIKTIKNLKLWENPAYDPRITKKPLWSSFLKTEEPTLNNNWTEEKLAAAIYPSFAANVDIELVRLSQLVKISFTSTDKELAAAVPNKLAEMYIDSDRDARFAMAQSASQWLNGRVGGLREKLDKSEYALQKYRETNGIISLSKEGQNGTSTQIADTNQQLITAKMKRAEAENAYRQVTAVKNGDYSSVPAVITNPQVSDSKRQEAEAERKVSELIQRYGEDHPKMVQAEGELRSAKINAKRQVDAVVGSLRQSYEAALGTERALEAVLNQARGAVSNLNRKEVQLGVLEREAAANRQLYESFIARAKETAVSQDLQSAIARIIDNASIPNTPIKPKKLQIIMMATLLGLLVAASAAVLLDRLNNTINNSDDVERLLGHPLLTSIPLLNKKQASDAGKLVLSEPRSIYAESIFTARTGVALSSIDATERTLLITSSMPNEGKTTFASNLALALSSTRRTLIIDADLRKPGLARKLGLNPASPGLSNLVAGNATLEECLQRVGDSQLYCIGTGDIPPSSLEILMSKRFSELLKQLSASYEMLVIDGPPLSLVSDPLILAPLCSDTLFVTRAQETPHPIARKNLARLTQAGGRVLGVTLSHLDFKKAERYYGQYGSISQYGKAYGAT
ncbi:GumC family protein [Iodobacter fluviatilis]|uniref:Capsular exopolysaccharide synthesis family protein n=1 Tax=Iodobacter fluviatilis TaxID=537 RepID=A0A377Q597_9NEIS|nr:polysaccharide biosynthesis tyrosine autokinase [Iodobacter fluviatilis]TCU81495.1 capsular exopolysaccharide synthesis family protein [Iodobacter fluviatilis]STQ89935.1 Tyrosine-protein kinase ptk [Iodobacter fluviatilis]